MNTFQCVLASSTSESYAIFLYEDLQWTTGDRSGGSNGLRGTEALVGFNVGDRVNSITVPGSRMPNITNTVNTSNIGTPGIWMFKIDERMYAMYYVHMLLDIHVRTYVCIHVNVLYISNIRTYYCKPMLVKLLQFCRYLSMIMLLT